jgi:hypothetical protein
MRQLPFTIIYFAVKVFIDVKLAVTSGSTTKANGGADEQRRN